MPLSQGQKNHITEWRKDRGIDRCLACGYDGEMQCGDIVVASHLPTDRRIPAGVETGAMGMVPVVCPQCGYMMLFEPVVLGLLEGD